MSLITKEYQYTGFNTDILHKGMPILFIDHCYEFENRENKSGKYIINGFEDDNKILCLESADKTIVKINIREFKGFIKDFIQF